MEFDAEDVHRRRGRARRPHARRLDQARARGEGPVGRRACARATRCWRCCAGSTQGADRRSSPTSAPRTSSRINDVPASTGYGDPVQKLFKFGDGERVVGALSLDARARRPRATLAAAVSKRGFGLRFALEPHRELSTRAGRRFAKPAEGDEIVGVARVSSDNDVVVRGHQRRARAGVQGRRDRRARRPGPRRHRDQGGRRRPVVGFGVGRAKDKDVIIARDRDERQGAARRPGPLRRSRRAAARATR